VSPDELRLLGNVSGKRVLELGCSDARAAIELAGQGAHVIAMASPGTDHDKARDAIDRAEAKVELHEGDLADLAFIRADTVDAAFSDGALRYVADVDRVFRQVHRVLRTDGPLLISVPHPFFDGANYFDRTGTRRTVGDLFGSISRAHFAVDTLLEPENRSLVLRGRKLGN
jgi:SAM-dependent methyltransferase